MSEWYTEEIGKHKVRYKHKAAPHVYLYDTWNQLRSC